jgi:flavin-binding protein dodecin
VVGDAPEVTVEKAVELIGTGDSVQDAVAEALDRARMSLEGITGFEVTRISGVVDGATTEYRVEMRVWFVLRERMHG